MSIFDDRQKEKSRLEDEMFTEAFQNLANVVTGEKTAGASYSERLRTMDVMEELVRFTILTRPHANQLVARYSERKAAALKHDPTTDKGAISLPQKRPA